MRTKNKLTIKDLGVLPPQENDGQKYYYTVSQIEELDISSVLVKAGYIFQLPSSDEKE
jgi:hypothetical protein